MYLYLFFILYTYRGGVYFNVCLRKPLHSVVFKIVMFVFSVSIFRCSSFIVNTQPQILRLQVKSMAIDLFFYLIFNTSARPDHILAFFPFFYFFPTQGII